MEIDEHDVGAASHRNLDGLVARSGATDHGDPLAALQRGGDAIAHDRMIIHDQHPNRPVGHVSIIAEWSSRVTGRIARKAGTVNLAAGTSLP
ncbi:MAG: hypothetical protein ACREME_08750 [Gemmatimonadales bacterium]